MYLSQFDIDRARRALNLGLPVTHAQMEGILAATDGERERAALDAREEGNSEGYAEAEADYQPDADKAADLADDLEKAQDTIEALQDRIAELMNGDMRNAVRAKLEALQADIRLSLGACERYIANARSLKARRQHLDDLARSIHGAFASAMPPAEKRAA